MRATKLNKLKPRFSLSRFKCVSTMLELFSCLREKGRAVEWQQFSLCIFWQVSVFFPAQETALLGQVPKVRQDEFLPECITFSILPHPTLIKLKGPFSERTSKSTLELVA